jgi:hypothetical protein
MSLRNLRRGLAATHPAVFGIANLTVGIPGGQITAPQKFDEPDRGCVSRYAAGAAASSAVKPRVLFGSTGMPGPIVVVNVTFFR